MKIDKGLMGGSSTLLVLSLLAEKDCYGYEMIRTLADLWRYTERRTREQKLTRLPFLRRRKLYIKSC